MIDNNNLDKISTAIDKPLNLTKLSLSQVLMV
jgi:hypothetical protein